MFSVQSSDKATGTIVATFKTDRPANYIDCGLVTSSYIDKEKVTKNTPIIMLNLQNIFMKRTDRIMMRK